MMFGFHPDALAEYEGIPRFPGMGDTEQVLKECRKSVSISVE